MDSKTRPTLLDRLREASGALAWEDFFQQYWRLIYAAARGRGCSEHTAEEIVQEVMLAVFQQRDVFHYDPQRGRFRDWLGTVVRHTVARHRRQPAGRVRALGGPEPDLADQSETGQPQPDAAWQAVFEEALLVVLLNVVRREVAPETFQAFELVALHELPADQVAEITGLTRNAVYLARRRILRRLQELGASYRDDGRLHDRIRRAMQAQPGEVVERSLTTRIEKTMGYRR